MLFHSDWIHSWLDGFLHRVLSSLIFLKRTWASSQEVSNRTMRFWNLQDGCWHGERQIQRFRYLFWRSVFNISLCNTQRFFHWSLLSTILNEYSPYGFPQGLPSFHCLLKPPPPKMKEKLRLPASLWNSKTWTKNRQGRGRFAFFWLVLHSEMVKIDSAATAHRFLMEKVATGQ